MNKVKVSKEDKKVFNGLNKFITDINNNKIKKEDAVWRLKKGMSDLIRLRQKQSSVFQNNMIQVVYQLFNSFGFNKEFEPLFSEKKSDQLQLPNYVKVSCGKFYKIENNIDNSKGLTTRIKDELGKIITIHTKYAVNLIDFFSKNKATYDEAKTIFDDKIVESANIIASEKPNDNRNELLKVFLDLREVFTGKVYSIKIVDDKYEITELKNKAADEKSKLKTQNEPLKLDKGKEPKF